MEFPRYRPRRLRRNETLRRMVRETRLSVDQLILPLFVVEGRDEVGERRILTGHVSHRFLLLTLTGASALELISCRFHSVLQTPSPRRGFAAGVKLQVQGPILEFGPPYFREVSSSDEQQRGYT